MSKSYQNKLYQLTTKEREEQTTYLTGLFTSHYKDEFMLHYQCPLCGEQVVVIKKLDMSKPVNIDYEREVGGKMTNQLRELLVEHYQKDCGSERPRRHKIAEILIDKLQDKVYS